MLEFAAFTVLLLAVGVWDIRSMLKSNAKKVFIPYIIIALLAVVLGFVEFRDPYHVGIATFLLKLINAQG